MPSLGTALKIQPILGLVEWTWVISVNPASHHGKQRHEGHGSDERVTVVAKYKTDTIIWSAISFGTFMPKNSDQRNFILYFILFLGSSIMLFWMSAKLATPFKELIIALDKGGSVPFSGWISIASASFTVGLTWAVFYLVFEYSKKGIIDLLHKKKITPEDANRKN